MTRTVALLLALAASTPAHAGGKAFDGIFYGTCTGSVTARPGVAMEGAPTSLDYDGHELRLGLTGEEATLHLLEDGRVSASAVGADWRVTPAGDHVLLRSEITPTTMELTRDGRGLLGRLTSPLGDGEILCAFERD